MSRLSALLILSMITLISCVAPKTESPTQVASSPSQPPIPSPSLMEVPSIGDGGLITGQPCASPCFFGIQIGETQLDQVVSVLENNGVSSCAQDVDSVSCGLSIFIGTHSPTPIIDSIGYSPSVPVSIEAVIKKYGNPDLIQIFPGDVPESLKVSALLFWDSINMRIHLPEIEGQSYVIEKATYIEWITFFDENLYSSLITSRYSQKWNGHGVYTP